VTHPFHPLAGQRMEVLFERRVPNGLGLSCDGGRLGRILVLAAWTDRTAPERPARLSFEALVNLAAVITALRSA
jgi:hypothetical protein